MSCIASRVAFACLALGLPLGACEEPERPAKPVDPYSSEGLRARYGTDLGPKDSGISYYTRMTDADPCSGHAITLADELLTVGANVATVKFVTDTLGKCPPSANLQWKRLAANKDLARWEEALADADALVKDAPTDNDFWWWRGEILEEMGNFAQALVDYQQSLALSPGGVHPARRLLRMPEKAKGFHCPAAFAIHRYIDHSRNDRGSWGAGARDVYLAGACDDAAGRGNLGLTEPRGAEITRVEVALGKTTDPAGNAAPAARAELVWNPGLGVTVLSKAFAARAGVPLAGSPVRVYVNGAHLDATLVELDLEVSLAQVPKLPVAIVEQVPGGGDGVLGGDFMWRFKRAAEGDNISLTSWR